MGRRKKKDVIRCNVCGLKATKHVAGDLDVCDNIACLEAAREKIAEVVKNNREGKK